MKEMKEIKNNEASEKGLNTSRRRAVFGTLAGATAVTAWHKPVITSVMLPAHAQTSPATMALTFFASGATVTPIMVKRSALDLLIPQAVASEVPITSEYSVSVQQTAPDTDSYQISVFERLLRGMDNVGELLYSGTAGESSPGTLSVTSNPCELETEALAVSITSISEMSVSLEFTGRNESLEVPAGSGSLPTPICALPQLQNFAAFDVLPETGGLSPDSLGSRSIKSSLLDAIIPTANAGNIPIQQSLSAIALDQGNGTFAVSLQDDFSLWSGVLTLDGGAGSLTNVTDCEAPSFGADLSTADNQLRLVVTPNQVMVSDQVIASNQVIPQIFSIFLDPVANPVLPPLLDCNGG